MRTRLNALAAFMKRQKALVLCDRAGSIQAATKPEIQRIALIPIAPPADLYTEDKTLAEAFLPTLGYLSMDDRRRRSVFNRKMGGVRESLGAKLTAALHDELKAAGFGSSLIESAKRWPNGRDTVDYKALPTRDAVLHVTFTEVGMSSSRWSNDYEPKVNARACLLAQPVASNWMISDHFFYGAHSSGDTAFSIPTDPKHRYPSFNALIDRADEMPQVYEVAVQAIAERISRQLCAHLGA